MKLNKKKFLKSLEVAVSVAKNRSTMPILSFLKIEAMDGQMTIHATDLDSHVQSRCECEGSLPAVCVPAQLLHGLAKSAGDDITLTMEKERLRFVSNGSATLSTLKADEMPPFPDFKAAAIGLPCADLADGIDAVSWCCVEDNGNGAKVTMVYVKVEPKAIKCYTINGKQMAYFNKGVICAETEFIFPAIYSPLLAGALAQEGANLHVSENQVAVFSGELDVSVKRWDGPFVSVQAIIDGERKPAGDISLPPLMSALEAAQLVGSDANRFAKVNLLPGRGRTRVQCQSPENAYLTWLSMTLPCRINVDATKFLQSLSRFKVESVKLEIGMNECLIMQSGDLTVVNATCIKDGVEIEDPEYAAELDMPPEPPKVINPDDYKHVKVDF